MDFRLKRATASVDDLRDAENNVAAEDKLRADLDYVAIMTDVDLPEDEEATDGAE